jgi:hypothetical protein
MADFATWAVAAESAHTKEPIFLSAYQRNRAGLNQVAIDASVIGPAILQTLNGEPRWSGLLTELLEELTTKVQDSIRKSKSWPAISRQLKDELTRLSPNLRQIGIQVTFPKRTNRGLLVELERGTKLSSLSTPSPPRQKTNDLDTDDARADEVWSSKLSSCASSPSKPFHINTSDDSADSADEDRSNMVEEIEI